MAFACDILKRLGLSLYVPKDLLVSSQRRIDKIADSLQ